MASSGSSSPLSSLSSLSPPPSDDEMVPPFMLDGASIGHSNDPSTSPEPSIQDTPKKKREASPPHEETLADNPDIAFIVMFRSRFSDAFPAKLINLGPQDIERGVMDPTPSPQVEQLLCAILGLALNRKKPVESGHYGRALEEALSHNRPQWPRAWNGVNPISATRSFNTMGPTERLSLLRALIMWSLHDSDAINAIIKDSYKQSRQEGDLNQPLAVQPWGRDGDKRRYWLIEGRDDTPFRIYRESNPALKTHTWRSVAGSIEDLQVLAEKLNSDKTQHSKRLAQRITMAIPRFEATEEKRKRREYRMARKAAFTKPEPEFSMYEGRTRGKRMRYTYSEEEEDYSESASGHGARRSTRNSGVMTPAEPQGPTITQSGRQVRSRVGGLYGESLLNDSRDVSESEPARVSRSGQAGARKRIDDDDDSSEGQEWDGGDEDDGNDDLPDDVAMDDELEDEDDSSSAEGEDTEPKSLVVMLKYGKNRALSSSHDIERTAITLSMPQLEAEEVKTNLPAAVPTAARLPALPYSPKAPAKLPPTPPLIAKEESNLQPQAVKPLLQRFEPSIVPLKQAQLPFQRVTVPQAASDTQVPAITNTNGINGINGNKHEP